MNNTSDRDATSLKSLAQFYEREIKQCELAWRKGSVVALTDAIILCHLGQLPMPLWLAHGGITLIKQFFEGKALQQRGRLGKATTRSRTEMLHYERWDAVKDLEDRKDEIMGYIRRLSPSERDQRPKFAALELDYSLGGRCEAVAELFTETRHPAKGSAATILRSYKLVNHKMRRDNTGGYHIPSHGNPLGPHY